MCTLAGPGRHSLSTVVTCLNLLLSGAGQTFVLLALYLKFVLESRVAVVIGNHGGALAYFLIAVGCILGFVSMASSKVRMMIVIVLFVFITWEIHVYKFTLTSDQGGFEMNGLDVIFLLPFSAETKPYFPNIIKKRLQPWFLLYISYHLL